MNEHYGRGLLVLFSLIDETWKRELPVDRHAKRVAQHSLIERDQHHQRRIDPFTVVHEHRGDGLAIPGRDHLPERVVRRHQACALNDSLSVLLEQAVDHERPRHQRFADRFVGRGHADAIDERESAHLHEDHQQQKQREDHVQRDFP